MPPRNRRMPLSCEPCRERKIKCVRGDGKSPCASCVRRGVGCFFLLNGGSGNGRSFVDVDIGRRSFHDTPGTGPRLLERIHKLEAIVSTLQPDQPVTASATATTPTATTDNHHPPSTLILSPSGHERYAPQTSMWSSALDGDDTFPRDDASAEFPFATVSPAMDTLLSSLPAMSHCDQLKDTYFDVFAPLFHIPHDPTFNAEYARFRALPESASRSWLALLYVVLSVAVPALDVGDSALLHDLGRHADASANVAALTARFRAAAVRCLDADHYLWRHNLHTLQALLLLVYGINHSHGQSWALLGAARNIALALGCHIDPDNLVLVASASGCSTRRRLNIVVSEQRRRCWAALTMLYVIQNTTLGSIDPAPLAADSVRLPRDANDHELEGPQNVVSANPPPPCTQMTYLLYKFRLYDICSRICSQLFNARTPVPYVVVTALDDEITSLQQTWQSRYQADTQDPARPFPAHHTMHMHILLGYSHQLRLLLHRPVLLSLSSLTVDSSTSFSSLPVDSPSSSRARCIDSALALLAIHRTLYETDSFRPFRWYTCGLGSFHAFHAAVLLAYVSGTSSSGCSSGCNPGVLRTHLQQSLHVFLALTETGMSRICEKAAPVLERLIGSSLFGPPAQTTTTPAVVLQSLTPPPSNSLDNNPSLDHLDMSSCGEQPLCADPVSSQQLEAVLGSLQVHQWLSPGAIQWNDWDVFMPYS